MVITSSALLMYSSHLIGFGYTYSISGNNSIAGVRPEETVPIILYLSITLRKVSQYISFLLFIFK